MRRPYSAAIFKVARVAIAPRSDVPVLKRPEAERSRRDQTMSAMRKLVSVGLVAATLAATGVATSEPALARDWDRGHHGHHNDDAALLGLGAVVGLGAGLMLADRPARTYYAPPPPVVYAPAPVYYDDYYGPRRCQEFQRDEYRHGRVYRSYYTACREPDGRWYPR
jgi:hypothetical protein